MAKNQQERVHWAIQKSQEHYDSAADDLKNERKFPAAEAIFRSVESCLTALLYNEGIQSIEWKDWNGILTGRLAHQYLVREYLYRTGIISNEDYQTYLNLVNDLHHEGYRPGKIFEMDELLEFAEFAEGLLVKVKTAVSE